MIATVAPDLRVGRGLEAGPTRLQQGYMYMAGYAPDPLIGWFFSVEPEFFVNLQSDHDLKTRKMEIGSRVE